MHSPAKKNKKPQVPISNFIVRFTESVDPSTLIDDLLRCATPGNFFVFLEVNTSIPYYPFYH